MSRVSLRNTLRGNPKTKLQSYPNSVIFPSNNEKRTTQAQQNLLKRERYRAEHKATKHHVEVGIKNLHRIQAAYIPVSPRQPIFPRRSGSPKGSGEVLERDRGSKSPVSFQPPPRGANKIYNSDTVFSIGEANRNDISPTLIP